MFPPLLLWSFTFPNAWYTKTMCGSGKDKASTLGPASKQNLYAGVWEI